MSVRSQAIRILGLPIEIYKFEVDDLFWYYTSSDEDYEHEGIIYEASHIKRGKISIAQTTGKSDITLQMDRMHRIVKLVKDDSPISPIRLTITRIYQNEDVAYVIWKGSIAGVNIKKSVAEITCDSRMRGMPSAGLRRSFQLGCSHVLYGPRCKIVESDYQIEGTVEQIIGKSIVVNEAKGKDDDYYAGGTIRWQEPSGLPNGRRIDNSLADGSIIIQGASGTLLPGLTVKVSPGCPKDIQSCHDKFGNHLNFGGFPFIPKINPFTNKNLFKG